MFCVLMLFVSFVCFKQKTAYEMRISDWSSDVCSSDLFPGDLVGLQGAMAEPLGHGVEALTPVTLCVLPRGKLYEIFRVHPELGFDMTWLGAKEEEALDGHLLALGRRTAAGRSVPFALYLFTRGGKTGVRQRVV